MKYYKNIEGGFISAICTGHGGEEITQEEYENIFSVIRNRPAPEAGFDYRLRTDLTWELVEVPADEDMEAAEEDYLSALAELGVTLDEEV